MNERFKDTPSKKEELLDELINALYEVTEDNYNIQRIDEILDQLEQIDPTIFEPFSVEESYQKFINLFREMEISGAFGELYGTTGIDGTRA